MEPRRIGLSDLYIMPLVLGGNVFGWTADPVTSFAILDTFVDAGFNAVDTAELYSQWVPGHVGGESESVIGAWLKSRGRRERVVLATKVGGQMPGWDRGLSAASIIKSAEGSLARLQTDYIDLYQSHADDAETPLEETLDAYDQLIRAGKVRAIGASHYSVERLHEALELSEQKNMPRYNGLQPRYNLCDRAGFESALQRACVQNDVGVMAYSSLAKGFLTGKYRTAEECSGSQWRDSLLTYLDGRGARILSALEQVAAMDHATLGEVALAWVIAQPAVAAAIVAVNNVSELNDLLGATRVTLDEGQLEILTAASAYTDARGGDGGRS